MKSLKEYFNVYSVKVVSAFSDVDAGDSALGTIFYGGLTSAEMTANVLNMQKKWKGSI